MAAQQQQPHDDLIDEVVGHVFANSTNKPRYANFIAELIEECGIETTRDFVSDAFAAYCKTVGGQKYRVARRLLRFYTAFHHVEPQGNHSCRRCRAEVHRQPCRICNHFGRTESFYLSLCARCGYIGSCQVCIDDDQVEQDVQALGGNDAYEDFLKTNGL